MCSRELFGSHVVHFPTGFMCECNQVSVEHCQHDVPFSAWVEYANTVYDSRRCVPRRRVPYSHSVLIFMRRKTNNPGWMKIRRNEVRRCILYNIGNVLGMMDGVLARAFALIR